MFKRVIWFGSGVASGVVGSWWTKRKVKKQVEKLSSPEAIREMARKSAVGVASNAVAAASTVVNTAASTASTRATNAASVASSTMERYRSQARDKFFERRRRDNIRPVPD